MSSARLLPPVPRSRTTTWSALFALAAGAGLAGATGLAGPAAAATTVPLSSLTPTSSTNGWGPVERNTSNGEAAANDGRRLTINGTQYATGLGVHAASTVTYALGGAYDAFSTSVGVDDEAYSSGSVVFTVVVDGTVRWTSPLLRGTDAATSMSTSLIGARTLQLKVSNAGDGNADDHADWAGAQLSRAATTAPAPVPTAPAQLPSPAPTTTPTTAPTAAPAPVPVPTSAPLTAPTRTTGCVTSPHLCGFPDETTTGPAAAGYAALAPYTGPYTITTNGTVVSGKLLTQPLVIRADDVVVQGNRLAYGINGFSTAITVVNGSDRVRILDNDLFGLSATDWTRTPQRAIWVQTPGVEIRRNHLKWISGDAFVIADGLPNQVITDNFVHEFTNRAGEHFDGIPADGGDTNLLIRNNTMLMWAPGNMTGVIGFANIHPGSYRNVTIDHNLFAGGGYTIYGGHTSQYPDIDVRFTNNQFSTVFATDCGAYSPAAYLPPFGSNGNVWSGNVWHDGPRAGQPVTAG